MSLNITQTLQQLQRLQQQQQLQTGADMSHFDNCFHCLWRSKVNSLIIKRSQSNDLLADKRLILYHPTIEATSS